MDALFKVMREDIVNKLYSNDVSLDYIAGDLEISIEELIEYLRLDKKDYLIFKNIDNAINEFIYD